MQQQAQPIKYTCLVCDENNDITALHCGHIFCTDCVIKLVKTRNRKCPLCRTRITWNIPQLDNHIKLRYQLV